MSYCSFFVLIHPTVAKVLNFVAKFFLASLVAEVWGKNINFVMAVNADKKTPQFLTEVIFKLNCNLLNLYRKKRNIILALHNWSVKVEFERIKTQKRFCCAIL